MPRPSFATTKRESTLSVLQQAQYFAPKANISRINNSYFMQFKIPKDTQGLAWTKLAVQKMMFYGLSAMKVQSILSRYDRMEQGIADNTVAVMKKAGSKKNPQEIWVMYQDKEAVLDNIKPKKRIVITAWRYPGVSKPNSGLLNSIN